MTKRKKYNNNLFKIGEIIKFHRLNLSLNSSRENFLVDRINKGFLNEDSISLENLKNIENGNTLPSLPTLKLLANLLEIDFFELLKEIYDYI